MKITCPNCTTKLTLDAGFEGGVCRCSHCGKMLKVPRNKNLKSSSSQSGSRPEAPRSASRSHANVSISPSRGNDSSWLSNTVTAPAPPAAVSPVMKPTALPPSPPNWQPAFIGAGVTLAGVAILLTLTLVLVQSRRSSNPPLPVTGAGRSAAVLPTRPTASASPKARPAPKPAPKPKRDPHNPFVMTQPNVAGMVLRGRTTILVDAIAASKPWLKDIQAALATGLSRPAQGVRVRVFYLSNKKLISATSNEMPTGPRLAKQLASTQASIAPAGKSGFWTLFDAGTQSSADHIILITSRTNWKPVLNSMQRKLTGAPHKPTFSVINMDASVADLKAFTAKMNGQYKSIPAAELNRWKREAR